ncbi:MAG: VWA domain-containing protein, partial [Myxococcota bacterium]
PAPAGAPSRSRNVGSPATGAEADAEAPAARPNRQAKAGRKQTHEGRDRDRGEVRTIDAGNGDERAKNEVAAQLGSAPADPNLADPTGATDGDGVADGIVGGAVGERANGVLEELRDEAPAENRREAEKKFRAPPVPVYDWGATVYLSNDDSMSLASAQRVLWALSRDAPVVPSQIRKHELLNYFSFDTAPPGAGRTFGILGSAARDGDTLTVALAVKGATPPRRPLDLTVVVDRSGSMLQEGRMDYTKRGLHQLIDHLQPGDRLDLVLFDSKVCTPVEGFVVGRDDPTLLGRVVDGIQPKNATDLDAGLREAYAIQTRRDAADTHGRNRRVLVITDAELNSGNVSRDLVSEVGAQLDANDIHLSGVGVGRTFDDEMLDLLTEKGRGAYVYLGSEVVVDRVFGPGFDSLVETVAEDVKVSLDLPDSLAMAKFYGEEMSTDAADVKPISYHAGTAQLFLQDLKIADRGIRPDDPLTVTIAFRDPGSMEPVTEVLRTTVGALLDADPHNLYKGQALMAFADWTVARAEGEPCGAPLDAFRGRLDAVRDDAELAFVDGLVARTCGGARVAAVPGVELKVNVAAELAVGDAVVTCSGWRSTESLSPSDTIARFTGVPPGTCTLALPSRPPVAVEVPPTGKAVTCTSNGVVVRCG